MNKLTIIYLILGSLAASSSASAAAIDCINPQTQSDITQCASEAYKAADQELNSTYQEVLKRTNNEHSTLLRKAQELWIQYRDADCKFQSFKTSDGSVGSTVHLQCITDKTKARTAEFKTMLQCPEGDITCPL